MGLAATLFVAVGSGHALPVRAAAPSYVQSALKGTTALATTLTVSMTGVASGDLLVAQIHAGGLSPVNVSSVQDGQAENFQSACIGNDPGCSPYQTGNSDSEIYYLTYNHSGAANVTVTMSGSSIIAMTVDELAGVTTFDSVETATATSTAPTVTDNALWGGAIFIGSQGLDGTTTMSGDTSGFTVSASFTGTDGGGVNFVTERSAYQVVSSFGAVSKTYGLTLGASRRWVDALVAFTAPAYVKSAGAANATASQTQSVTISTSTDDMIVAAIEVRNTSSTPSKTVSAVTDSAGNTWHKVASKVQGTNDGADLEIWSTSNLPNAVSSVQVDLGTGNTGAIAVTVAEFSGVLLVDQSTTNSGGSGTAASTGTTGTTTSTNELVVAALGWNGTQTISGQTSGYTTLTEQTSTVTSNKANEQAAYRILTSTGTQSYGGTLSSSDTWEGVIATFS
jgi:hypothetical protein